MELDILTIISTIYAFLISWSTEYVMTYIVGSSGVPRGGLGGSTPRRNSEDIGGVLDRMSKKNRRLDFLLQFTVFSYSVIY